MKASISMILAVVAILVGMGFVMPAIAKLNASGSLPGADVFLLFLGVAIAGTGLVTGILRLRNAARRG